MTLQVFRDGRPDKGVKSHALLAKLQREDDYENALKQHIEKTGSSTYGYMGEVGSKGSITASRDALGTGISRAERIARVRDRMSRGECPQSLFYEPATGTDLLAVEDAEAYEEGWICPNCIQYQAIPSNKCNWRFVGERPSNPDHWGCGYDRDLF